MPKIVKQSPTTKKSGGGIRSRIQDVGDVHSPFTMTLYGRSGSGKTRLLSTFPKPLLIAGTETGTASIKNVKGVKFVRFHTTEELSELITIAREDGFKSFGLDQATGLADMTLKQILGLDDLPAQSGWGMATQQQYGQAALQMKERLREVLRLAEEDQMNVIIVAHERNFNEEGSSDLLLPTVGAALSPSVTGWLNAHSEYIAETFIRPKKERKEVEIGGKKKIVEKTVDGAAEFCLRVGPHGVYTTKFRVPEGVELPDLIVNPSYEKIAKLIA